MNFFDNGQACAHKSHQGKMGDIGETERTSIMLDRVGGAEITCSVTGESLGPFSVSATLNLGNVDILQIDIDKIDGKATEAAPAKGSVAYSSSITASSYGATDPCDFYIEPAGPSGVGEGVQPGAAWLSFKCPTIVSGMSTCVMNESYVLVENCVK